MAGSSAAAASAGWHRAEDGSPDRGLMSIGEVLAHLRADFPDITISKLRFLEAEGLVEPLRTPAGYRKYSPAHVERLRLVLGAQRDRYLPLRVIREQLEALERGERVVGALTTPAPRPAPHEEADPLPASALAPAPVELGEARLTRMQLAERS